MSSVLTIRNLSREYDVSEGRKLAVLRGVDLDVAPGELVGLVGPSGSGKSSLLHAAGLLEAVEADALTIDGEDFVKADDTHRTRARLARIGFVYQFHHLLPEFTALGNVALPQRILGRKPAEAEARARELLEVMGLKDRMDHLPGQLSGGEQQRVAVARALANGPKLLLADEPTGNLDPATSKQVFDVLKAVVEARGVGAVIATHNLELSRHMHRVVRLEHGKLVEDRSMAKPA
jgi:lipoprotein-releasing system ATP-binding protein